MDKLYEQIALQHDMSLLIKLVWQGRAREAREHLAYFIDLKESEENMKKTKLLERISHSAESGRIAVFTDGKKSKTVFASTFAGSIAVKRGSLEGLPLLGVYSKNNIQDAEKDLSRVWG